MKSRHYRSRILQKKQRRKEIRESEELRKLEEGAEEDDIHGEKREISERQYDQMMIGSMEGQIQAIQELQTHFEKTTRMFRRKELAQRYPDSRMQYFQDDEKVWCEDVQRRVGFIKDKDFYAE